MTPAAVLAVLDAIRVVPVVVLDDPGRGELVASSLAAGGIGCGEITLRTPAGLEAIRSAASVPDFVVGAGTVLRPDDVDRAVDAGAQFIVTPGWDERVVERALLLGVAVVPGIGTAGEVQRAISTGLDRVKLFPAAQLGGIDMIRALGGPFPAVRFLPSGGVSPANARAYLDVPSVFAISGSWMVPRAAIAAEDGRQLVQLAAETAAQLAA